MKKSIEHGGAENARNENLDRATIRLINAAKMLDQHGESIGQYFLGIDEHSIATQRATKHHLAERLRQSDTKPQIVTVQARGEKKGGAYLIIPLEKAAEVLEAQIDKERFVPITVLLRKIGGDVKIPDIAPRRSNWRQRQGPVKMIEPEVES